MHVSLYTCSFWTPVRDLPLPSPHAISVPYSLSQRFRRSGFGGSSLGPPGLRVNRSRRNVLNKDVETERWDVSLIGLFFLWVPAWSPAQVPVQRADAGKWIFYIRCHCALSESLPNSTIEWRETTSAWASTLASLSHCWYCHHPRRDGSRGLAVLRKLLA